MDEGDFDYMVADRLETRMPAVTWNSIRMASIELTTKAHFERIGISIERDNQITVMRVQDDVIVRLE